MLSLTFFPLTSILCTWDAQTISHQCTGNQVDGVLRLTRKSTPIVALASSSGNHCSSENRMRRLLLPTEEFPISSSLQLMIGFVAAIGEGEEIVVHK